mgnify:CR=1 FL=1
MDNKKKESPQQGEYIDLKDSDYKKKSNYLRKLKRVEAERILLSIIKKDFGKKIHAFEIKLE